MFIWYLKSMKYTFKKPTYNNVINYNRELKQMYDYFQITNNLSANKII